MAPQFVKPYVKSNKNDAADAEAICEAVGRPSMRFVSAKSVEQQDMQARCTGFAETNCAIAWFSCPKSPITRSTSLIAVAIQNFDVRDDPGERTRGLGEVIRTVECVDTALKTQIVGQIRSRFVDVATNPGVRAGVCNSEGVVRQRHI